MEQKLRAPGSPHDGITQALAILGDDAAKATGLTMSHLRHCADVDTGKRITLEAALALDTACARAGHATPIVMAYLQAMGRDSGVAWPIEAGLTPPERVNRLTESLGDISRAVRDALADGRVSEAERISLERAIVNHDKWLRDLRAALLPPKKAVR